MAIYYAGERVTCMRKSIVVLILLAGLALAGAPALQIPDPDLLGRQGGTIGLGQIIRFRVIAASDSVSDQAVKLRVRDAVLDYLRPELQDAAGEPAAAGAISERLPEIRQVAQQTVQSAGSPDQVRVSYGVTAFPDRVYGPVVYPAGNYQALKIEIGEGQGENWWCVLFPPLCYVDLTRAAQDLSGGQQITWQGAVPGDELASQYPRLTTKIGTWIAGARSPALASGE
jgi:stage II sporulation protein R